MPIPLSPSCHRREVSGWLRPRASRTSLTSEHLPAECVPGWASRNDLNIGAVVGYRQTSSQDVCRLVIARGRWAKPNEYERVFQLFDGLRDRHVPAAPCILLSLDPLPRPGSVHQKVDLLDMSYRTPEQSCGNLRGGGVYPGLAFQAVLVGDQCLVTAARFVLGSTALPRPRSGDVTLGPGLRIQGKGKTGFPVPNAACHALTYSRTPAAIAYSMIHGRRRTPTTEPLTTLAPISACPPVNDNSACSASVRGGGDSLLLIDE